MGSALQQHMSLEAFLDWEDRQPVKFEFDGFQPRAMTGGSAEHAFIQSNLLRVVGNRLRGGPCRVVGSELKILVDGSIRYPDAFILCSPQPFGTRVAVDPVMVFEILSPSTSIVDRIEKNREYRATPSIQRYVILEQNKQAATIYARAGADWVADILLGDVELALPEVGISVPLAEIYQDVEFQPEAETT